MSNTESEAWEEVEVPCECEAAPVAHEPMFITPAVDVYETESDVVLVADLPGVDPDELDLDFRNGILTLAGRSSEEQAEGRDLVKEYKAGSFFRQFRVGDTVDTRKAVASMEDGVLRLVLPKSEKTAVRRIAISS